MKILTLKTITICLLLVTIIGCGTKRRSNQEDQLKAEELHEKAGIYRQRSMLDSALVIYDQLIELNPKDDNPHSNKMGIYVSKKEYVKALYECEQILEIKPDFAEIMQMAGMLNEHLGDHNKAVNYFEKSIQIFSTRIADPEKQRDLAANKINRAISKKFVDDESYIEDFKEFKDDPQHKFNVELFGSKSKTEMINIILGIDRVSNAE